MLVPLVGLAGRKAVVSSRSMNVYRAKNSVAGRLSHGTVVTIKGTSDGVAKISYKGKTGYALMEDLQTLKQTEVCIGGARVYISKNTGSRSVTVQKGTKVNVVSVSGDWARIERNGRFGYVQKDVLELYRKDEPEPPAKSKTDVVVAAAMDKLGCRYVYGNSGPDVFDCSGFTKYLFRKVGISLSGSAYGQGYGKGTMVGYAELRRGDIVCFNTNENDSDMVDHVGLYLGSGEFIHASSARGEVIVSKMNSGYYKRVFSWGRRVV